MAFPQGTYFRATDNQVDPSNYDAEVSAVANYPRTSAQGNSVGWETIGTGINPIDRNVGAVVALKGMVFCANASTADYRIDLPSTGLYNIRLAMGDEGFGQNSRVRLFDNATQFSDIDASPPIGQFYDATGVLRTSVSDWDSNNAILARTFASTIFRIRIGGNTSGGGGGDNSVIAAVYIEAVGGGGGGGDTLMGQAVF